MKQDEPAPPLSEPLDKLRAVQLKHLETIYSEAIAAFERSRQDVVNKRTVEGESTGGGPRAKGSARSPKIKVETSTEGAAGDAKFLVVAREALADMRTLLGLDAGRRPSLSKNSSDPPDYGEMNEPELQKITEAHWVVKRTQAQRTCSRVE